MIYWSIIIVVIFEKLKRLCGHIIYDIRFQRMFTNKMRHDIPYTLIYVQMIHQNVVYIIAELRDGHFMMIGHFFDNCITYRIEYVYWEFGNVVYQRK